MGNGEPALPTLGLYLTGLEKAQVQQDLVLPEGNGPGCSMLLHYIFRVGISSQAADASVVG